LTIANDLSVSIHGPGIRPGCDFGFLAALPGCRNLDNAQVDFVGIQNNLTLNVPAQRMDDRHNFAQDLAHQSEH